MRIIKKYDNRCLYDTELSSNITLQDLKQYVLENIEFKVINAKTEEDITRTLLIQIILELESLESHLFNQDSLRQIIRFYGDPLQKWLQQYLEQSLTIMAKQQQVFHEVLDKDEGTENFFSATAKLTANNLAFWQEQFAATLKTKK